MKRIEKVLSSQKLKMLAVLKGTSETHGHINFNNTQIICNKEEELKLTKLIHYVVNSKALYKRSVEARIVRVYFRYITLCRYATHQQ